MRIVIHEFYKVFSNKKVLLLFLGLILLNGILLYLNENDKSNLYSPSAYKQIFASVEGLSNDAALHHLEREQEELKVLTELSYSSSWGDSYEEELVERFKSVDIPKLIEKYNSGDYLTYTESLWTENALYDNVIDEIRNVTQYADYLQKIEDDAKRMTSISIFAKPGTFPYRNIAKTPEDFAHLKDNQLSIAPSKGVKMATEFLVTDLIAIILMMVIGIQLLAREKEQQSLGLIKTTYKGRVPLIVSKLSVAFFSSLIILILLYAVNFAMAITTYGFGDVGRYIQSVAGYRGSSLEITVLQYLILFLIAKLIVYILISLIFFAVSVLARSSITVYISIAIVFGVSSILYFSIPPTSVFSFFKYINLIHFLNTYTVFSKYLNLNIGGYPFQYTYCFIIITIIAIIILSIVSIIIFCKQRQVNSPVKTVAFLYERLSKMKLFRGYEHVSVFRHELYKIMITNKAFLILLAFIALQIVTYQQQKETFADINEVYYKRYMLQLEGENNEAKEQFLADEQQRFDDVNAEMLTIMESGENTLKLNQLSELLAPQEAFNKVLSHAEYVREFEREHGLKGWYLYDAGYQKLTAADDNNTDLQLAILMMIVVIAAISAVYTYEMQTKMVRIVSPTKYGRSKAFYAKLIWSLGISTVIFIAVYGLEVFNVLTTYGTRALHAPIYSMPHMANVTIDISILQYLIFISIVRFIGLVLAMLIIFSLSVKLKSLITVALTSTGILVLPLLLSLLDIKLFDYVLLTPILSGNILFKEYSFTIIQQHRLYMYMFTTICVIVAFWIVNRLFVRGYIRH